MESDNNKMGRVKKKTHCLECKKEFCSRIEYQKHRKEEHSRKNVCQICKRIFASERRLRMHSQFHSIDGEYKCFYCSKRFNKAWKMRIHLVNHSGRPPYTCEFCGDDFLYPGKIVKHLKFLHDIYYACKDCGQAMTVDYNKEHECKVYGCKDCLMCFTTEKELATHVENNAHGERYIPPAPISDPTCTNTQCGDADMPNTDTQDATQLERDSTQQQITQKDHSALPLDQSVIPFLNSKEKISLYSLSKHKIDDEILFKHKIYGETLTKHKTDECLTTTNTLEQDTSFRLLVSDASSNNIRKDLVLVPGNEADIIIKKEEPESSLIRPVSPQFKVPETSKTSKGSRNVIKRLCRKGEESKKRSEKHSKHKVEEVKVSKGNKRALLDLNTSLESWLSSSDIYASPEHDYVFGFEASVSVNRSDTHHHHHHRLHLHHHYYTKKLLKKEKVDMTFEDLCQF